MAPLDPRTECCPAKQAARDAGTFEGPSGDDWFHNADNPCKGWPSKKNNTDRMNDWLLHLKHGHVLTHSGIAMVVILQVAILWFLIFKLNK